MTKKRGKNDNKKISLRVDHQIFSAVKAEKREKNKKEAIKKVENLFGMKIDLFLRLFASQIKKIIKEKTLIDAKSTPEAGFRAIWKGRYRAKV